MKKFMSFSQLEANEIENFFLLNSKKLDIMVSTIKKDILDYNKNQL